MAIEFKKRMLYNAIVKFNQSEKHPVDFERMFVDYYMTTRPDAGLIWPEIREVLVKANNNIPLEDSVWIIVSTDTGYRAQCNWKKISDDDWDTRERLLGYLVSRGIDINRIFYYD